MKAIAVAVVSVVLRVLVIVVAIAQRTTATAVEAHIPTEPAARMAPASGPPIDAPPVPLDAETLMPLTYVVETQWERPGQAAERTKQTVTRTKDRVRLVLEGGDQEWVFERNAVHGDRVSGWLIKHAARQIVAYDDSHLLRALQIRGWADVLMMRVDPRALETLQRTGERREHGGAEFVRYVSENPAGTGVLDVWWSQELLLPDRLAVREGETVMRSTVTRLDRSVDAASPAAPRTRFPDYDVIDVSDAADHRR